MTIQPTITLKKLLRMIFPTEDCIWLSEIQPDDQRIQWVVTDYENAQMGDLLLLAGSNFNSDQLVDAIKSGVEAVLIIGEIPNDKSLKLDLPILQIKTSKDIRDIQRELILLIGSKNIAHNERSLQIHIQLTQLAADGAEIMELTKAMSEITRHGVLIQDKRMKIIAGHPSPDLVPVWENITEKLSQTTNLPGPLQDRQMAGEQNKIVTQDITGGISRVIVPITVSNVARGYLSIIGLEGTLDTLDHLVAEEGALICAIDMSRTKAVRETEKKLQSDLLTALLQENLSPRDAKLWVEAMGLDQTQSHAALQFTWGSQDAPSRRRLETIINGEVARMGVRIILNPTGDAVICFCQVPPENNGYQVALDLAQNVLVQASKEYPDTLAYCGIGAATNDLNQWHISFREAGLALDMAVRLNTTKPLYYPDLSIYRLLMLLEDNPELKIFMDDTLGILLSEESNNKFIETLEAYFEKQGNLSQTADALFIHRNTLTYRLERIAEITGMDINIPDTALAVQLALKIYRMLDKPEK